MPRGGHNQQEKNGEDESYSEETIAKLCQEGSLKWDKILPLALFRIRVAPKADLN